jgi:hypothetical protein
MNWCHFNGFTINLDNVMYVELQGKEILFFSTNKYGKKAIYETEEKAKKEYYDFINEINTRNNYYGKGK